ncbi:hypothetical protein HK28_00120 [Acetobacter sp. DsW_063]|nr:hypothetical protein HK28_00120 [Acetobacter sp. DsW_063]
MAKFIILTDKNGSRSAVNLDSVAEITENDDGVIVTYCSGNNEVALCGKFCESFDQVIGKVNSVLADS